MEKSNYADIGAAIWMVGVWSALSLAGSSIMGLFDKGVHGPLASLGLLAVTMALLFAVTKSGVNRIAALEIPSARRWGIVVAGCMVLAGGFLAVRFGAPFRGAWEGLSTGGQLLMVAATAGYLPRFLNYPAELLPLVSVMICADAVSYLSGPTHHIAEAVADYYTAGRVGAAPVYEVLLMKFPTPGSFDLFPFFGVADWFMVVFLWRASRVFDLEDRLAGVPLALFGLFLAVALARLTGFFIPALPVLALFYIASMVIRHGAVFKPGRREILLGLCPPALSLVFLLLK